MSETRDWKPISTAPERKEVWTKIDDAQGERNVAHLKRIGRLWFFPDGSMYVYYAPTHWAELEAGEPSEAPLDTRKIVEETLAKHEPELNMSKTCIPIQCTCKTECDDLYVNYRKHLADALCAALEGK